VFRANDVGGELESVTVIDIDYQTAANDAMTLCVGNLRRPATGMVPITAMVIRRTATGMVRIRRALLNERLPGTDQGAREGEPPCATFLCAFLDPRCPHRQRPAGLFDHLVGAQQERFRNCEVEGTAGCEIDYEIELGRSLDRYVGRLRRQPFGGRARPQPFGGRCPVTTRI
jgi:hypothetical protein